MEKNYSQEEKYRLNDSNSDFVNKINSLIKKSFGYFYRGNWNIVFADVDGELSRNDSLEFIATKGLLSLSDPIFGCGVAGLIGNGGKTCSDGSIIAVRKDKKKYLKGAEKYAKLYKEEFGKEVEIIQVKEFSDLINGYGIMSGFPHPIDFGFHAF